MEFLLILLVLVAFGAIAWAVHRFEQRRREALAAVAARLGLRFHPGSEGSLDGRYGHEFFRRGHSRRASNTMVGALEMAGRTCGVRMGDYRYRTGAGKNQQTHNHGYALIQLPWVGTPDLLIRKEHVGDKLKSGLGFDDIDFESEEFSRTFWVTSGDKKYAYDVVHPRMMRFLLDGPKPHVEIVGDVCLVLDGRGRWDPGRFETCLRWVEAFLALWPEHVTERLTPRRGVA